MKDTVVPYITPAGRKICGVPMEMKNITLRLRIVETTQKATE